MCKVCKIVRYCSRYCAIEAHRNGFENWHAEHCTRLLPGDKIVYNREAASGHVVRDGPSEVNRLASLTAPPAGPAPPTDADGKFVVDGFKDRDKVQAYIANKLRDELLANPDVDVDEKIDELVKRFRFTFDDAAVRAARLGGGPPGPGARGGAGSTSGRS